MVDGGATGAPFGAPILRWLTLENVHDTSAWNKRMKVELFPPDLSQSRVIGCDMIKLSR
jgi:hypothetical protein